MELRACHLVAVPPLTPDLLKRRVCDDVFLIVQENRLTPSQSKRAWGWGNLFIRQTVNGVTSWIHESELRAVSTRRIKRIARLMLEAWERRNPGHPEATAFLLIGTQQGRNSTDLWWNPNIDEPQSEKYCEEIVG